MELVKADSNVYIKILPLNMTEKKQGKDFPEVVFAHTRQVTGNYCHPWKVGRDMDIENVFSMGVRQV